MVLTVLLLTLLVIPLIGLAIDGTTLYMVRAKASQAADSAALAGARALPNGTSAAQSTAAAYFQANFPNGLMGVSYDPGNQANLNIEITSLPTAAQLVNVTASLNAPTYFMRIFGFNSAVVATASQVTRSDINLMLVLDRSGSMYSAGVCNPPPATSVMTDAQTFVSNFEDGRDTLGLISFMAGANVDYPPNTSFNTSSPSIGSVIGELQCRSQTGSAEALTLAYQQIQAIGKPGGQNIIVFFTDGQPDGINVNGTVKTVADTRWGLGNNYNTLTTVPASPCTVTTLPGVISNDAPSTGINGYTIGMFSPTSNPLLNYDVTSSPSPCASYNSQGKDLGPPSPFNPAGDPVYNLRQDLAFIPNADAYGNATNSATLPNGSSLIDSTDYFPSGSPYAGQLRPDQTQTIKRASLSAAYAAAATLHADTNFNITVYCIGLGGTTTNDPVDPVFLSTVANDPDGPANYGSYYNPARPPGSYVYAPTPAQLSAAYRAIASKILRLSH